MKENSIEELKQTLEELYRTQKARLDVGADDLDIREKIAEVEEEIKELQDETMEENSIKNERSSIKEDIERLKLCSTNQCNICGRYEKEECMLERNRCEQHILSAYKRVLKENEELKNAINVVNKEKGDWIRAYQEEKDKQFKLLKSSIPIQKIKDKIEEIKERKMDIVTSLVHNADEKIEILKKDKIRIQILQELLESEE